ncbi:MAG: hypothetical protein ACLSH6_07585 [Limosilactobacillus pontis]
MRVGTVTVNGRQLTTRQSSRRECPDYLTPTELKACGVQAIKQDAIDYWCDSQSGTYTVARLARFW